MAVEQQLVDYIKKAREAKQSDEQSRALLYKNGWTEAEVSEATAFLERVQPKPQAQPQIQSEPEKQILGQPSSQPEVTAEQPQQPQYKPQAIADVAETDMPKTRKSHRGLKVVMVLIVMAVLLGVGYFFASQYISLPWFKTGAEKVISNMVANMKTVKSSSASTQVEVTLIDSTGVSQGKLSLNSDSKIDLTDANNPSADVNVSIATTPKDSDSAIMAVDLSIRSLGQVIYFKLNNLTLPDYSYSGIDISQAQEKWFKFDQESLNVLTASGAVPGPSIDMLQANNLEINKQIQNLIFTQNALSVKDRLEDEVISGQNAYHYAAVVNKDKIKDLLNKIIDSQTSQDADVTPAAKEVAKAFVNSFLDKIGDINLEMWIGKKDFLLYQVKFDKTIDLNSIYPAEVMPYLDGAKLQIKASTVYSDYNKPITVQAPVDSQKIEGLLSPVLIEFDIKRIGAIAELLYSVDKSYSSLCAWGLLNGYQKDYGDDLINLNNDIIKQGAGKPACYSGTQSYCVSTKLANGTYLCIGRRCASYNTACK